MTHEHAPGWAWCGRCGFWAPRCETCFEAHAKVHHIQRRARRVNKEATNHG